MKRGRAEELQTIVAQGRLDRAVAILQRLDPTVAADTLMSMPYEEPQVLFHSRSAASTPTHSSPAPRAASCRTCTDSHCHFRLDAPGSPARLAGQWGSGAVVEELLKS